MTAPRFVDRLSTKLSPRMSRRGFFARSAVVGSALAAAPVDYVLKPGTAYAAICNCYGSNCECGSTCCDGYTEFCCTIYGNNQCPPGTILGGWWKADGTGLCGGPRYYMDCNSQCGSCGCGGSGVCSGTCTGTPCGCANGSCGNRKSGCTHFRYGQCNQGTACIGPIVCRVVTCIAPWNIDSTCTTLTLVDQNTAFHDRPCLHRTVGGLDVAEDVGGSIRVAGWALDFDTSSPIDVHIYVDNKLVKAVTANGSRPDIAAAYKGQGAAHGFDTTIPAAGGPHRVDVYAINAGPGSDYGNPMIGTKTVTIASPFGSFESVAGGLNNARLVGWAIDPDTANPVTLHVYIDGVPVGAFVADKPRPDVGAAYPNYGPNHGFDITVPTTGGQHTITVYGINYGNGSNAAIGSRVVYVNPNPIGSLDLVAPTLGQLRIVGWAIDPDTTNTVGIHVYVDGAKVHTGVADKPRSDIGVIYPGYGPNHGFDITLPIADGDHTVDVYAINAGQGDANPLLGRRVVHVGDAPLGNVEAAMAVGVAQVRVVGWALDQDTPAAIDVHVYVDGVKRGEGTAQLPRPDVAAVFPGYGENHGFDIAVPVTNGGPHTVHVYAINVGSAASNPLIGTKGISTGGNPFGSLDSVTGGASPSVRGWAADPDTTTPVDVHVYADGVMVGALKADQPRPDVGAAIPGAGPNHGFDGPVPIPAGTKRVDVYAINTGVGDANPLIGSSTIS